MKDLEKILNPEFWKSFRIPAAAFAVLVVLLIFRDVDNALEYAFIQKVASYAIGASVIAYGHFLFHATWVERKGEKDLPFLAQIIAMAFHALLFAWFIGKTIGW